jgi:predicted DNA binding CopG/RHH family protein
MSDILDDEEKDYLDSYNNDEWKSVSDLQKQAAEYSKTAKATLNKNKRINIRITEKDYELIQRKAIEEGLPYQTLLSSLIHKYLSGKLVEKDRLTNCS